LICGEGGIGCVAQPRTPGRSHPMRGGFTQNEAIRCAHSFFCLTDFAQACLARLLNRKTRLSSGFMLGGGVDEIQLEHLEGILKVVEEIIKK